ncbi:hypothetical protein [Saccharothrix lopnurensis]|uniref:Uncharacterized protein n=1 Tax=Saccharothrix lopnurensis TaxID=1670621 RepID=A0ABW1P5P9_9PSEU
MSTGYIPVRVRVGDGTETIVGSVRAEPITPGPLPASGPVRVRIAGGSLAVAELLEQAATELRRRHAQDTAGFTGETVLVVSSLKERRRYTEAHPDRWTWVVVIGVSSLSDLEGLRVHSVDVTDTVNQAAAAEALEVLHKGMDFTPYSNRYVRYLHDVGAGGA